MTAQVGKLQPSVPRHFKHGVVQPGGKLLDERRLPTSRRAVQVQRIKVVHEPDDHIPCRFMENVGRINGWGVRARFLIPFDSFPCRRPRKDLSGIKLHRNEGGQFLEQISIHGFLL